MECYCQSVSGNFSLLPAGIHSARTHHSSFNFHLISLFHFFLTDACTSQYVRLLMIVRGSKGSL